MSWGMVLLLTGHFPAEISADKLLDSTKNMINQDFTASQESRRNVATILGDLEILNIESSFFFIVGAIGSSIPPSIHFCIF